MFDILNAKIKNIFLRFQHRQRSSLSMTQKNSNYLSHNFQHFSKEEKTETHFNSKGYINTVSHEMLLCDIEVPENLSSIRQLTIDTFISSITVGQVLGLNAKDKKKYTRDIESELSSLQLYLVKILQTPPSGTLPNPEIECPVFGPTIIHTTSKGKLLNGWFIDFLSEDKIKKIDPYTFRKNGKFFVRSRHHSQLLEAVKNNVTEEPVILVDNRVDLESSKNNWDNRLFNKIAFSDKKLPSNILFEFDEINHQEVWLNHNHKYIKDFIGRGNNFLLSLKAFISFWMMIECKNISREIRDRSIRSRIELINIINVHTEKESHPAYMVKSLPSNILFDSQASYENNIILINDKHLFNQEYVLRLNEEEKKHFIKIYASWLLAEKKTLSNKIETALKSTRELLGTEFFNLIDEAYEGKK